MGYLKLIVGDTYNPIEVGEVSGFSGGNSNGFSYSKFNSPNEPTALVTEFGYPRIIGFKIYLNKTTLEKQTIAIEPHASLYYFPIFVDETNKHLLKRIRVINPNYGNLVYGFENNGVYYDGDLSTIRKSSFVLIGNSFSGYTGSEFTDITVPDITTDTTIENVFIGLTRLDASRISAKMDSSIGVQYLDNSGNVIRTNSTFTDDPAYIRLLMGYDVSFGTQP